MQSKEIILHDVDRRVIFNKAAYQQKRTICCNRKALTVETSMIRRFLGK